MRFRPIRDWRVATKVTGGIVVLVAAFGTVFFGWVLPTMRDRVYTQRRDAVRQQVETAYALVVSYGAAVEQGRLPDEQGRKEALAAVAALRYDTTNYFWINDSHPRIVLHPIKPEMNGQDVSDYRDPEGRRLFVMCADTCRQQGAGFVDYSWPKPGSTRPQPKISYVKRYARWDWIIGTGAYVDDIEQIVSSMRRRVLLVFLVVAGVVLGAGLWFGRSLAHQLGRLEQAASRLARGDIGVEIAVTRGDEIGRLAGSFQAMAESGRQQAAIIHRVAAGDLGVEITPRSPDDVVAVSLQDAVTRLRGLVEQTGMVSRAAVEGRLGVRGDPSRFDGAYREVVAGLNATLDAVVAPLNVTAEYIDRISKGDLPPRITDSYRGDFREVTGNLNQCIDALNSLEQALQSTIARQTAGEIDARCDTTLLQGTYAHLGQGVNRALDAIALPVLDAISVMTEYARGDLHRQVPPLPGKQIVLTDGMNAIRDGVRALVTDAGLLAHAAVEGRLATRADPSRHQGDYRKVIEGVNATLDAVVGPLNVAAEYVDRISQGEVPPKIEARYHGDFNEITVNLNRCIDGLGGLLEANSVLQRMAVNDLTHRVEGHYSGVFAEVARAVDDVRERLCQIQATAVKLAQGDLSDLEAYRRLGDGTGRRSDHDQLTPALTQMMESIAALVRDMGTMSQAAVEGRLSARADTNTHRGEYRRVVAGVNATLDAVTAPIHVAASCVDRISKGDVPDPITTSFNGEFDTLRVNLNTCIQAIRTLVADTNALVESAIGGHLGTRADARRHQGDFRRIVEGINGTLDALIQPITEASAVLARVAQQDLRVEVAGQYTGDHAAIKQSINTMVTDLRSAICRIGENAKTVGSASDALMSIAQQMAATAEETSTQTNVVSAAAEQVSRNLTVVATASEEMLASIREIAKSANQAARMAKNAVTVAQSTNSTVQKLGSSSVEIGNVVKVITAIAGQTNLLALNATIEAARAGDAGKGFAVVANEVKELAKETATATEDISHRIEAIQEETQGAVAAITEIVGLISQIDDVSNTIASAVEEQTATTNEIGHNITEAARGSSEIARNVSGVAGATETTAHGAADTQSAARQLTELSAQLQALVGHFAV